MSAAQPPSPPHRHGAGGFSLPLAQAPAAEAIDPVCGMTVDPAHATGSYVFEGRTYYFCVEDCRQKFLADPRAHLDGSTPPAGERTAPLKGGQPR